MGNKGMCMHNNAQKDGIKRFNECQENIPHTFTQPPPAWTVDTEQLGFMARYIRYLHVGKKIKVPQTRKGIFVLFLFINLLIYAADCKMRIVI